MFLSLLQEKKKEKKTKSSERKAQRYFPFRSSLPLLSSLLAEPSDLFPPFSPTRESPNSGDDATAISRSLSLARSRGRSTNQPTHPHPWLLEEEVAAAAEEEEVRRRHAAATRRKRRGGGGGGGDRVGGGCGIGGGGGGQQRQPCFSPSSMTRPCSARR